jgi:hypothetical protein
MYEPDDDLTIREPDFVAESSFGSEPRLKLVGSADTMIASSLRVLTDRLHKTMAKTPHREIVVDMRRLEFMSAAACNAFVGWIGLVGEMPREERYKVRFLSNGSLLWQKRTLGHLASFAPDVVVVVSE